ncbi:hypothetical protein ABTP80_03405 [Acinetobacter baumannii]|uniref:hypothetical protein n=1 Tax=Acinetobacter baumannii TaxID=470 RepID=UPI002B2977DA|nr:hypothetical protein R3L13_03420 [Acinetobacter baumannii]
MAGILKPEDFKKVRQDIQDAGKAANEDVIVNPRYGKPFKSLPMLSRLFEGMLSSGYIALDDLQEAINIAAAAGAGANGWDENLVRVGSSNQKTFNDSAVINFESLDELLAYTARTSGQTVYLKSIHKGLNKGGDNFVFKPTNQLINDGGNIFNGWTRQVPESYFNAHNFGAIGDGSDNKYDHEAFVKISNAVIASSLEAISIHIPDGKYVVGKQSFISGQGFISEHVLNINFSQMTNKSILLKSDGANIKLKDGLYFGVFDKITKKPFQTTMPFYPGTPSWTADGDKVTRADTGYIINFSNIKSFVFSGKIDIDGNQANQIIGGQYGDSGWQLMAYGFRIANIKQLSIENITSHDNLLDGFYIAGYNSLTEPDKVLSDVFGSVRNVVSYHNSRQACSFCGGQNVSFYDCVFSDTATSDMKVRSMPMSGLDIEAEVSPIRNARFYNLRSFNNAVTQVVADSADTKNVHFYSSRFLSPAGGVTAWVRKPQFKFFNCYFNGYMEGQYGTSIEEDRTLYQGCTFTDDPNENPNVGSTTYLINGSGANPKFDDCKFNIFKSGWLYDYGYSGTIDRFTVKNSEFNIYTDSAAAAMNGIYENIVINDFRPDPTKIIYPTLDNGRYNNVVVKSPTGASGISLYGSTNLANTRNAVFTRSSNPYDVLEITPFELKGFHVAGNQGVSSLVKVGYSPFLNLMNIQYNTGDTIHCTMPSSGVDKWICVTSGIGSASVWKKVPLVLQGV